jgi:hypothetical protein
MKTVNGEGWVFYQNKQTLCLKFNHAPDGKTLNKLRGVLKYDPAYKIWTTTNINQKSKILEILKTVQTWESIGEHTSGDGWEGLAPWMVIDE